MATAPDSRNDLVAWKPGSAIRERARLTEFIRRYGYPGYPALYDDSVRDIEGFTGKVLEFLDVRFDQSYSRLLDPSRGPAWPAWCVGGKLNISRSCLDRHLKTETASRLAVIWEGEDGATESLTYRQLADQVERCSSGLRAIGVQAGDAVGIHLPMLPETVVTLLALARIAAVAVPLFSGYGPTAIRTRLRDVGAKALIGCEGFRRRGRWIDARKTIGEALRDCPSVIRVVIVGRDRASALSDPPRELSWSEMIDRGDDIGCGQAASTEAEDPLIVLYTSGTTGRPKGIRHTHCSFPVKAAQDMAFGTDVGSGDHVLWVTDLGWMMGPWLIYGATMRGATIVLYDGALDHPHAGRLWEVCSRHRVGVLGVSPTLVRSLMPRPEADPASFDLSSLRILASTGEPWNTDPWWWLFERVGGGRLPVINYSGGTEIAGGILMGNPLVPVKPCAFSAPCPGIAADVVDEAGRTLTGEVGELVIRRPWIGMARGFHDDPQRYLDTYWSRWPGVWVHGDWARRDPDGQWFILGRSDDTFNVGGKRVGPAEVESILVAHSEVREAAVVGVPDALKGTALVAVCVAAASVESPDELARELRERVGRELGKPLRPDRVLVVDALPQTRNGKIMRRVVRAAVLGEPAGDVTALENPDAVEKLRRFATRGDGTTPRGDVR